MLTYITKHSLIHRAIPSGGLGTCGGQDRAERETDSKKSFRGPLGDESGAPQVVDIVDTEGVGGGRESSEAE